MAQQQRRRSSIRIKRRNSAASAVPSPIKKNNKKVSPTITIAVPKTPSTNKFLVDYRNSSKVLDKPMRSILGDNDDGFSILSTTTHSTRSDPISNRHRRRSLNFASQTRIAPSGIVGSPQHQGNATWDNSRNVKPERNTLTPTRATKTKRMSNSQSCHNFPAVPKRTTRRTSKKSTSLGVMSELEKELMALIEKPSSPNRQQRRRSSKRLASIKRRSSLKARY